MRNIRILLVAAVIGSLSLNSVLAAGGNAAKTRTLLSVLQSSTNLHDRARACQQLGESGTAEAVPALAALLGDPQLAAYARGGLENIPDPAAAAALRTALGRLQGKMLAGAVNSLGALRDTEAADALSKFVQETASGVQREALWALGRIGTKPALATVRKTLESGPAALRPEAAAACLLAAEKALADGGLSEAGELFELVLKSEPTPAHRTAATRGAIAARGDKAVRALVSQLDDRDPVLWNAALWTVREIPGPELAAALNKELARVEPDRRAALLAAIADCHDGKSLAAIRETLKGAPPAVRLAAVKAIGRIGGVEGAKLLLETLAADADAQSLAAAQDALGLIEGKEVDALVLAALSSASDARLRIRLIGLAGERAADGTAEALLQQAAAPQSEVVLAALRAVKPLAVGGHVPALIALTKACTNAPVRKSAETALFAACTREGDPGPGIAALDAELKRAENAADRESWTRLLAALAKVAPAAAAPLFDGKTLAGWEGNTNVWRVRDGVMVGGSLEGNPRNEFLATVRPYKDFVLRLEYKLVGTAGFVNGGVQFRSVRVPKPPNEMSGYQADLGAGHSGCLYDESRRNKFLARATDEQIRRLEKPGEWNRYEVRCEGARIRISLNGEQTVDYTEADPAITREGAIALQIHGGNKAEISFLNLAIEDRGTAK